MNENDRIFLEFWQSFEWPAAKPVVYKLYHTDDGDPVVYSTDDLPGKYIEVTAEQYSEHSYRVRVINGVLIKQSPTSMATRKLVPGESGTACHPAAVSLVVTDGPSKKWKLKIYDNN
jgi:hypothetical protein